MKRAHKPRRGEIVVAHGASRGDWNEKGNEPRQGRKKARVKLSSILFRPCWGSKVRRSVTHGLRRGLRFWIAKVLLLVFLFVVLTAASVSAQDSEITFYVGGMLGSDVAIAGPPLFQQVDAVFDDEFTGGFRLAYFFNKHFAAEGGLGFSPSTVLGRASFSDGNTQASTLIGIDTYVFHANVVAHLFRGPVIPYVTGGVGAVHFEVQTSNFGLPTPSETDFAWNAGGGVKIPFRDKTALRFDGRAYWVNPEFSVDRTSFIEVSGGLSILFDF